MSGEISLAETTGLVLYAIVKTATGSYLAGATPEAFDAAHWASYAIALAEYPTATGQYHGDFPAAAAGVYRVEVYAQAGATPATSDGPPAFEGQVQWTGTAEAVVSTYAGGAVASVTGAVGSVTGAVGSVTGAVGSVTGAVGSVTGAVQIDLTQALADVRTATVGGALHGGWALAFGKMFQDVAGNVLKLFGVGGTVTPLITFDLDNGTSPTTRTPP